MSAPNYVDQVSILADLPALAKFVKDEREKLLHSGSATTIGRMLQVEYTLLIDACIGRLYEIAVSREELSEPMPALAIVATGGYGRAELAPFSDVDVTFVPEREDDDRLNSVIKHMFQSVMDVFLYGAEMKVGYGYRPITDVQHLDHQTQTSLLDARFVAGDHALFNKFTVAFRSAVLVADFLFQKAAERSGVLARFGGDVPYLVEPNVKEGAGGLRDAQCVEWVAEVMHGVSREDALPALVASDVISAEEADAITRSYAYLLAVRTAVHCEGKAARDNLTADKQEGVAYRLGYAGDEDHPAVEVFMADYYRCTAQVRRIARKAMRRCLNSRLSLVVGGLVSCDRRISLDSSADRRHDPALPVHACELAQAYSLDFADAFDGDLAKYMRNYPVPERMDLCGRVFSRILNSTTGVKSALREMTERGILGWLIPEYVPLMVQIPYDVAHDLTVGEHSVRVAGFLEFLRETDDPRFSDYRRAWTSVQSPDVLFLAGLLHDIGKMWPDPKGHSEVGAEVGYRITIALGWDEERARKVEFLIRYHLLMAETSRLRDLRLEETIRDFTRIVDDQEKLSMLFLLTCADTSEVGVGIWSEMKGKFLAELFERASGILAAAEDLGGDQDAVFGFVPDLTKQRERVGKQLLKQNLPVEAVHEHTQRMTAQYLLTTPLEEIYLHMAMINRLRQTGVPTVDFRTESGSDFTELTIVAYDDPSPGLLAKIFGVMYALDITVHATHVFTRESSVRIAIDTLWVDFRGRPFSSGKKAEVQDTLRQILGGATSVDQLLERKKKPRKDQSIYGVRIDDTASDRYSLIEVRAPDETGVTYRLSRAMSRLGWNIVSARVSVWGSRVRAAFYIKDIEGRKIPQSEVPRLLAALPQIEYHPRATTHHGYNG